MNIVSSQISPSSVSCILLTTPIKFWYINNFIHPSASDQYLLLFFFYIQSLNITKLISDISCVVSVYLESVQFIQIKR